MKFTVVISVLALLLFGTPVFGQGQITLDHVDGLLDANTIGTGQSIRFYIRYTNNTGYSVTGATNGFRIYSPDGAQWEPLTYDTTGAIDAGMLEHQFFNPFSNDGSGVDTLGFGGFEMFGTGIPNGFDEVVIYIETKIQGVWDGRTLCLDTAFYRPGGYWLWSIPDNPDVNPQWDGPHCYNIEYVATDVEEASADGLPDDFELFQNHPNPFNPSTVIRFNLPEHSHYTLTVYNVLGREISQFVGNDGPGEVNLRWDGAGHAAGVYFYRLQAGDHMNIRKMVLVK